MVQPTENVSTVEYGEWRKLCFMESQLLKALEILEDKLSEDEFNSVISEFVGSDGELIRLGVKVSN